MICIILAISVTEKDHDFAASPGNTKLSMVAKRQHPKFHADKKKTPSQGVKQENITVTNYKQKDLV